MCLCILSACQAAEQVKLQCMLYHMTAVDHARVIPGMADSILALLPDAAGSTKLTRHMSALRQHAYIRHAYIVSSLQWSVHPECATVACYVVMHCR